MKDAIFYILCCYTLVLFFIALCGLSTYNRVGYIELDSVNMKLG